MSTIDTLESAARRLHGRGEHDLADLLRDIGTNAKMCLSSGQLPDTLLFFDAACSVAVGILAEPDQTADDQDLSPSFHDGEVRVVNATADPPSIRECLRLSAEFVRKSSELLGDTRAVEHRATADHYLRMAAAMHDMGLKL